MLRRAGVPATQCGGSWQPTAYISEEAVVSWTLSKEQVGTQPAAAVLAQIMEPHGGGMRSDLLM